MSRAFRLWVVLAVAYAIGKLAVDVLVDGAITDAAAGWLAIPVIAAAQAAILALVTRRGVASTGERA